MLSCAHLGTAPERTRWLSFVHEGFSVREDTAPPPPLPFVLAMVSGLVGGIFLRASTVDASMDRTSSTQIFAARDRQMATERKTSRQIYDESIGIRRQVDDGRPRQSEDDIQREQFGPRGVPGKPDPARMVPQRKKKTPSEFDPGHTA